MSTVYVVLATIGEYDDWDRWVAGIYNSRSEAEEAVRLREHLDQEQKALAREWQRITRPPDFTSEEGRLWSYTAKEAEAEKKLGPYPGMPPDDYDIVEVPIGKWGEYK